MRIRDDFTKPELVRFDEIAWVESPAPGVERKMLDRIGDEVARATSFVRYAPGSNFDPHVHDEGEEFLVLDGTFSDERGDYSKGTYVRNPPGSEHAPRNDDGCIIFVKLRQFAPDDSRRCVIPPTMREWLPKAPGVELCPLHGFGRMKVELLRLASGSNYEVDTTGGAEALILEGRARTAEGDDLPRWSWLRVPDGDDLSLTGDDDPTLVYLKTRHLP